MVRRALVCALGQLSDRSVDKPTVFVSYLGWVSRPHDADSGGSSGPASAAIVGASRSSSSAVLSADIDRQARSSATRASRLFAIPSKAVVCFCM